MGPIPTASRFVSHRRITRLKSTRGWRNRPGPNRKVCDGHAFPKRNRRLAYMSCGECRNNMLAILRRPCQRRNITETVWTVALSGDAWKEAWTGWYYRPDIASGAPMINIFLAESFCGKQRRNSKSTLLKSFTDTRLDSRKCGCIRVAFTIGRSCTNKSLKVHGCRIKLKRLHDFPVCGNADETWGATNCWLMVDYLKRNHANLRSMPGSPGIFIFWGALD